MVHVILSNSPAPLGDMHSVASRVKGEMVPGSLPPCLFQGESLRMRLADYIIIGKYVAQPSFPSPTSSQHFF